MLHTVGKGHNKKPSALLKKSKKTVMDKPHSLKVMVGFMKEHLLRYMVVKQLLHIKVEEENLCLDKYQTLI